MSICKCEERPWNNSRFAFCCFGWKEMVFFLHILVAVNNAFLLVFILFLSHRSCAIDMIPMLMYKSQIFHIHTQQNYREILLSLVQKMYTWKHVFELGTYKNRDDHFFLMENMHNNISLSYEINICTPVFYLRQSQRRI